MSLESLENPVDHEAEMVSALLGNIYRELAIVNSFVSRRRQARPGSITVPSPRVAKPAPTVARPTPKPQRQTQPANNDPAVRASVVAAREIIERVGKPCSVAMLYQETAARGFAIYTRNPLLTFSARLRDYKEELGLVYLKGHGWWLLEKVYKPASHRPTTSTGDE
jgi:hypothetical protein